MSGELFYLGPLNVDASSSMASIAGAVTNTFSGDATANIDIQLSKFRTLFQFQSDSTEINNAVADDIKFRVVYQSSAAPLGFDINTLSNVVDRPIDPNAVDNNITYDYTRYLALKLFNTHLGVDLFNNEEELRLDLNASFKTRFNDNLLELAARGATDQNDDSVDGLTHYNTTTPARLIFNQLLANKPGRFRNIDISESEVVDGKHWYKMPGEAGDKFFFMINAAAAENQQQLTDPLSTVQIPVRAYLISATVVPDSSIFTYSDGTTSSTYEAILTQSLYTTGGRSASQLVSVIVGPLCTSIGDYCFDNCSSLTAITISNSVTSIGNYSFKQCSGLTSVTIPDSVATIGTHCFVNCSGLTSVTLPINSDLKTLGHNCFAFCTSLPSITIPASIETLGHGAIGACGQLASVTFAANSNLITIGPHCFVNAPLTSITIPANVTTLGEACFNNCQLTSVIIPGAVTDIDYMAFGNCNSLTAFTLNDPSNIITMHSGMLMNIPGPITVTFNNTVDYAALSANIPVSTYFTEVPPANCASPYIFNA